MAGAPPGPGARPSQHIQPAETLVTSFVIIQSRERGGIGRRAGLRIRRWSRKPPVSRPRLALRKSLSPPLIQPQDYTELHMPDPSQMTGAQWIVTVLVGLVLIGLQAYVVMKSKNVATHQDVDTLTRVVEGIKADHARDLERLKSDLLKDVESHRLRYETELRTYKEIWTAAYEVFNAASALRPYSPLRSSEAEQQRDHDSIKAFLLAAMNYDALVWKHRPFYPNEVYMQLTELGGLFGGELRRTYQQDVTPEVMTEAVLNRVSIIDAINDTCEAIRKRLHAASQGEFPAKTEP
jgi:hypothetical protein